eukprot:TRINITY_DN5236_c0_g1_i2.p1 TRINITY_DN5236_c0_g1~~TRINITY_DN5236_c0_g1_i2.p1  ORF type:complete len:285 (-),score=82.22 TRINITY_DN5236_c0_g1_i2:61-915(-)
MRFNILNFVCVIFNFSLVLGGLPLSSFNLTLDQSQQLRSGNDESVALAQDIINDALKKYVKEGNLNIVIENNDIIIDAAFDDRVLKDRCSLKLFALHPRARGTIKRSSQLMADIYDGDFSAGEFSAAAKADLDVQLDLDFDFRAQIGAKIFGKCRKIGRDTLGIDLKTSGKAILAVALEATDIAIDPNFENIKGKLNLNILGRLENWNIDDLDVSKCQVKLFNRIEIGSYCSAARSLIREALQNYINKWTEFEAPKLIEKLERKMQSRIGDEIVIPLNGGGLFD